MKKVLIGAVAASAILLAGVAQANADLAKKQRMFELPQC